MPLRGAPTCIKCNSTDSPMWTNAENLGAICLRCVNEARGLKSEVEDENEKLELIHKRKSRPTRPYKTRLNPFAVPKLQIPKGKGRRLLSKKIPVKNSSLQATVVTTDSVFYKGSYIQVGDIVSVWDEDDRIYYAQIRGLLVDQYCEKSAVITWLLPTQESPPPALGFDPATYIIGPEEEIPRKLQCMEFVMHAPSDYYKSRTPYPVVQAPLQPGCIWTSLQPVQMLCSS